MALGAPSCDELFLQPWARKPVVKRLRGWVARRSDWTGASHEFERLFRLAGLACRCVNDESKSNKDYGAAM